MTRVATLQIDGHAGGSPVGGVVRTSVKVSSDLHCYGSAGTGVSIGHGEGGHEGRVGRVAASGQGSGEGLVAGGQLAAAVDDAAAGQLDELEEEEHEDEEDDGDGDQPSADFGEFLAVAMGERGLSLEDVYFLDKCQHS